MHELPTELTRDLRSWRGSVVRDSIDIEKAEVGERPQQSLRQSLSSVVLHPTKSSRALRQQHHDNVLRKQWESSGSRNVNNTTAEHASPTDQLISPARRAATFDRHTMQSTKKSVFDEPGVADPDGAASRFDDDPTPLTPAEFYELMGMAPPDAPNTYPKRFAIANGMYAKIKHAYDSMSVRYRAFNILTYFLMTLQLLLSAVFVILGSLGSVDSHLPIAILGAISTVVAGGLALMKGQGLPNRLRQTRDSLGYVLFEAQELWWDVGAGRPVQYKDVKKLREDYLRVLEEQRRNHPDTWNAYSTRLAEGVRGGKRAAWASKLTLR